MTITRNTSPDGAKTLRSVHNMLIAGCFFLPALYWVGLVETGPVEWLQSMGAVSTPAIASQSNGLLSFFQNMNRLTLWLAGGIGWALISGLCLLPFKRRIALKVLGSEEALHSAQEAVHLAETTPVPLGDLVSVTINRGGFMSRDESTIETTQGFYRVAGIVGDVLKGASVTELNGILRIASDKDDLQQHPMLK